MQPDTAKAEGFWGRIDPAGVVSAALQRVTPEGDNGRRIHPSQNRLISLLENTRVCAGAPDTFIGHGFSQVRLVCCSDWESDRALG